MFSEILDLQGHFTLKDNLLVVDTYQTFFKLPTVHKKHVVNETIVFRFFKNVNFY